MPPRRPPACRKWAAGALAVACLGLTGCASDPPTVAPSGVDMLEIPTESPDPADFAERIDNPWLPLLPDATWTFETGDGARSMLTSTGLTKEIAGVTVAEVRSSGDGTSVRWFAQDDGGNVWLFGATEDDASWEAGVDGARAGLAMPADPRRGDGWAGADAPGVFESEVTVAEVTDGRTVLEATTSQRPGVTVTTTYERGTGPVLVETSAVSTALVDFDPGTAAR